MAEDTERGLTKAIQDQMAVAKRKNSTRGHSTRQQRLANAISRAEKAEARANAAEAKISILKVPRLGSRKGRRPGRPRTQIVDFINMMTAFRELPLEFRNDNKARDNVSKIARCLLAHPRYKDKQIDERSMQRKVRNIIAFFIEKLTRPTDGNRREFALDLLFGTDIGAENSANEALILVSEAGVKQYRYSDR